MQANRSGALVLVALAVAGCGDILGDKGNAHQPGTDLGMFHVTAQRTSSTCGEGALGAGPTWEFDVRLSRSERTLYWNNGAEVIAGQLAEDNQSFSFTSAVVV